MDSEIRRRLLLVAAERFAALSDASLTLRVARAWWREAHFGAMPTGLRAYFLLNASGEQFEIPDECALMAGSGPARLRTCAVRHTSTPFGEPLWLHSAYFLTGDAEASGRFLCVAHEAGRVCTTARHGHESLWFDELLKFSHRARAPETFIGGYAAPAEPELFRRWSASLHRKHPWRRLEAPLCWWEYLRWNPAAMSAALAHHLAEQGEPPNALADNAEVLLVALLELGCLDADSRRPTEFIAKKAMLENIESAKHPMASLARAKLVATRSGRAGGCWLTQAGQDRAEKLRQQINGAHR